MANEWNELQTCRKTNLVFNVVISVFFLSFVGCGNWATTDPYKNLRFDDPNQYNAPMSSMLRFVLIASVYLLTGVILCDWFLPGCFQCLDSDTAVGSVTGRSFSLRKILHIVSSITCVPLSHYLETNVIPCCVSVHSTSLQSVSLKMMCLLSTSISLLIRNALLHSSACCT